MQDASLRAVLASYLRDPNSTWTCGGFGALAEFHFDENEAIVFADAPTIGAMTGRGAFRLDVVPGLKAVAYRR